MNPATSASRTENAKSGVGFSPRTDMAPAPYPIKNPPKIPNPSQIPSAAARCWLQEARGFRGLTEPRPNHPRPNLRPSPSPSRTTNPSPSAEEYPSDRSRKMVPDRTQTPNTNPATNN